MVPFRASIAVIGGSGLYNLPELKDSRWIHVESSFGEPSDDLLLGEISGVQVVFLPRHGRGHVHSPSDINYRANIDALKRCGVEDIISVSAVGSLDATLPPGTFILVDQYIDRTVSRVASFFSSGCVAHVSLAQPVCNEMIEIIAAVAENSGISCRVGGTYLAIEGPQFSSKVESELYRNWGANVIGMTNMPEARLAREAEMCYASICMVTDYDCWHPDHNNVTMEDVVRVMNQNSRTAQQLVAASVPVIARADNRDSWNGRRSLENAIVTASEHRDPKVVGKLEAVAGRVLGLSRG